MFENKYSKTLTIVLVVSIVGILLGVCFLGVKVYKDYKEDKNSKLAIAEFNSKIDSNENNTVDENNVTDNISKIEYTGDNNTDNNRVSSLPKKVYYKDFIMLGTIQISKTNVSLPILEEITQSALDTGACLLYKTNEGLNIPGNVVIIGHNYKNGKLFSNNKQLTLGDKISIKDTSGNEVSYSIYEIFTTTPEDTNFYNRDTKGVAEITLSTCTDDGASRLIILAKAN